MFKKLVWLLGLSVVLAVGAKGYLTFSAHSMLDKIKREFSESASIDHGWISADYDGTVVVEDLTLTFFRLKRSLTVAELIIEFDGVSGALAAAESQQPGDVSKNMAIKLHDARLPLKGKSLKEWVQEHHGTEWIVASDIYSCFGDKEQNFDLLQKMGISEIKFDARLSFSEEEGADIVELDWDIEQTGRLVTKASWSQPNKINLRALFKGELQLDKATQLELEYSDEGYIRRLRNACDHTETGSFADMSSLSWQSALASIGWQANIGVQSLYRDYLSQGGIISLAFTKPNNLSIDNVEPLYGLNLVEYFGFEAAVNKKKADDMLLALDEEHFRAKLQKNTPQNTTEKTKSEYRPGYRVTDPADLKSWLERKVRIQLKDGKTYEGILQDVAEHKVDMLVNVAGGTVVYSLKPHGIEKAEVWR